MRRSLRGADNNSSSIIAPRIVADITLQAVFRDAALVAASESRVLLSGESGVGKEVLVDVIHGFSRTETAKALGISRRALIYKLQRYREQGCLVDAR